MPLCRFWQKGDCRNGDSCRFEHPGRDRSYQNNDNRYAQNNNNRYAALQGPQNTSNYNQGRGEAGGRDSTAKLPYLLSKDAIIADLSTERPQWILSAYGPGLKAPAQLFGGPLREQSFEEMRLHHYVGVAAGNPGQAAQEAEILIQNAESQMQNALQDVDGAIQFILNAEKEHPNRLDVCNGSATADSKAGPFGAASSASNPFASNTQPLPSTNVFGQPSNQAPNPFGRPAQAATNGTGGGAFGRPSVLGQKPNPFGAPSSANAGGGFPSIAANPHPFGAPAQPANPNPFGAPSQPQNANPFGAPQQPVPSNPFGAPVQPPIANPFGAPPQPTVAHPFGAPSQPAVSNPFGAPAKPAAANPFGASPQPATSNPFGAAIAPAPQNPFGAPPQQPQASPFGNLPANPLPNVNPFGQPAPSQSNPFDQSQASSTPVVNAFTRSAQQPVTSSHIGAGHPPLNTYASRDGSGRLTMFKGKSVMYKDGQAGMRNRDGSWEKIWFADGAPAPDNDTEVDDELYDDDIKNAYLHVSQTGGFENGIMPLVPPKREWCLWDF